jgi:hypothetical protein
MDKKCALCEREFNGKGTKCGACVKKQQRAKAANVTLPPVGTEKEGTSGDGYFPAVLLDVDTSLPFSVQKLEAGPDAVHNTRKGKDEWVLPGRCKSGECLNPNCPSVGDSFK